MVVVADFRNNFPEFANATLYPDSLINFWLALAVIMVIECRWGNAYTYGIQLFTAHNLVIAKGNIESTAVGGLPGGLGGVISSKSVGDVSVSYDTNGSLEDGAGLWNLSTYGKQFIHMARMMGAGPVQF